MKNYDNTKEDSFITYLDMNNLYGASMSINYHIKIFNGLKVNK